MEEREEGRYIHLLQPIRDLVGNWDVDIASDLGEYLHELEGVTIGVGQTGTTLNFAEAALLIQGTTTVYSKKVEYLHKLVYEALQNVAEQRNKKEEGSKRERGQKGTAENGELDDAECEFLHTEEHFLTLDDVSVPQTTDINLNKEDGVGNIQDDFSRDVAVPYSEPFTAFQRVRIAAQTEDALNVTSCVFHESGALLLEPLDAQKLGPNLELSSASKGKDAGNSRMNCSSNFADNQRSPECALPSPASSEGYEADVPELPPDSEGHGRKEADTTAENATEACVAHNTRQPSGAMSTEQRDGYGGYEQQNRFDPWSLLDPDDVCSLMRKPLRKGMPFVKLSYDVVEGRRDGEVRATCADAVPYPKQGMPPFSELRYAIRGRKENRRETGNRRAGISADARGNLQEELPAPAFEPEPGPGAQLDEDVDDEPPVDATPSEDGASEGGEEFDTGDAGVSLEQMTQAVERGNADLREEAKEELRQNRTYGEQCRAYVEECIREAAAAEVQTKLAQRVAEWRAQIQPHIDAVDRQPSFDVDQRGREIVERVEISQGSTEFHDIVEGQERHDVCKTFAAILHAASKGNIVLEQKDDIGLGSLRLSRSFPTSAGGEENAPNEVIGRKRSDICDQSHRQPLQAVASPNMTSS